MGGRGGVFGGGVNDEGQDEEEGGGRKSQQVAGEGACALCSAYWCKCQISYC